MKIDKKAEEKLIEAIKKNHKVDLENYQKINLYFYGKQSFKQMKKAAKFKSIGNIYDILDFQKRPDYIAGFTCMQDFKHHNCVLISKKNKAVMVYSKQGPSYECLLFVDVDKIKKLSTKLKPIYESDISVDNAFKKVDFKCGPNTYIEVSESPKYPEEIVQISKKTVDQETLVFEKGSTLYEILADITTFFEKDTKKMYEQMDLAYKRGIILEGPPGNGKTALIREIIRRLPAHVTKVIMDTNLDRFTTMLSLLVQELNGKQAVIIIEDMDSVINEDNRSMFLNTLDGIGTNSGLFFIGTTNYIERLDSGLVNRGGRFDKKYHVSVPLANIRREFFKKKKIDKIFNEYTVFESEKNKSSRPRLVLTPLGKSIVFGDSNPIVELFTQHSDTLPMTNLKELMINTQYLLIGDNELTIEEAVKKSSETIKKNMADHKNAHAEYNNRQSEYRGDYGYGGGYRGGRRGRRRW